MDSFRELQEIYEGYRGQAIQFPEITSGVKSPTEHKHSYRKGLIPGQTPGKQNQVMSTIPLHSSDEEGQVDMSTFMRQDIVNKIDELIRAADNYDDKMTIFALSDLKAFVTNLKPTR